MLVLSYEMILKLRDHHNLEIFFAEILKAMLLLYRNLSMDLLLIWYNWLQKINWFPLYNGLL